MKLGLIGCGKMGSALVHGAIRAGVVAATDVIGCNPPGKSRDAFAFATGAAVTADPADIARVCDVILIATKPYKVAEVLAAIPSGGESRLLISVAAGITLAALEKAAPAGFRVVRAMPNTPSLVGKGAAGFCLGASATRDDAAISQKLLEAVGIAIQVPEGQMNAVTGVSGSGPAYIYMVIEALADGGVRSGMPRADALRLAAQTVFGAAAMVLETGDHPAILKDSVTSPGGTTAAALATLERYSIRSAFAEAVAAAAARADELGK